MYVYVATSTPYRCKMSQEAVALKCRTSQNQKRRGNLQCSRAEQESVQKTSKKVYKCYVVALYTHLGMYRMHDCVFLLLSEMVARITCNSWR